jgi:VIT1/CCC1 family predicted Fe2+/Mn2+ transporter
VFVKAQQGIIKMHTILIISALFLSIGVHAAPVAGNNNTVEEKRTKTFMAFLIGGAMLIVPLVAGSTIGIIITDKQQAKRDKKNPG